MEPPFRAIASDIVVLAEARIFPFINDNGAGLVNEPLLRVTA